MTTTRQFHKQLINGKDMHIVLEGPDNAGKSTLAAKLSERFGLEVRHSGGPSKHEGEVNERAEKFVSETDKPYIYDRHPCISQNIYVAALGNGGELVNDDTIEEFYKQKPIIIYCRSNGSLDGHEQSEHSSQEYFSEVEKNYAKLCGLYDAWGLKNATMMYRIGDDTETLIGLLGYESHSNFQDVVDFHTKFETGYEGPPRQLPDDLQAFRNKFLDEELAEYKDAVVAGDLAKQFDALIDLVYVAMGTADVHGFPWQKAWDAVQAANMAKVRCEREEDSTRGSTFDVIKPKGWTAPDIEAILRDAA